MVHLPFVRSFGCEKRGALVVLHRCRRVFIVAGLLQSMQEHSEVNEDSQFMSIAKCALDRTLSRSSLCSSPATGVSRPTTPVDGQPVSATAGVSGSCLLATRRDIRA